MAKPTAALKRTADVKGAVFLGLGSILGTGVFVILAMVTAQVGDWALLAVGVGAIVATFNGLNSAQLAAAYPVSGGAYEYGYRLLHPYAGFTAGLLFLLAKSASAATAALAIGTFFRPEFHVAFAVIAVLVVTAVIVFGLRRSNQVNAGILTITIAGLLSLIFAPAGDLVIEDQPPFELANVLQACALIFVAYTGYGRIATMGEEIIEPRKNIPKAMIITLLVSAALYAGVALAWLRGAVPTQLFEVAGYVALIGVLLNLILGLSRVLLAMARRGDVAHFFSKLDKNGEPLAAILGIGGLVALLCLLGDIKLAWSFSACTVLIYYAIMNAAALKLTPEQRMYPKWLAWVGLASCLFLAFWVPMFIWGVTLVCIGAGMILRWTITKLS
ncbi:APC family permease [Cerasicoccus fimbriatus]|uniref:APC family permease n=1 Tax=Cerasicoccus fimbriatus TaxID=3014554 RepID=UPI0022B464B8|nr:amino acid permease [Cerasicoccus sp. TK19100]